MRVFLDTNILLDVLLNRPSLAAESEEVILRCEALGAYWLPRPLRLVFGGRPVPAMGPDLDGANLPKR